MARLKCEHHGSTLRKKLRHSLGNRPQPKSCTDLRFDTTFVGADLALCEQRPSLSCVGLELPSSRPWSYAESNSRGSLQACESDLSVELEVSA